MIYKFRNEETGETAQAESHSLNTAARKLGIDVPYRGKLPQPWTALACHTLSGTLVWDQTQL